MVEGKTFLKLLQRIEMAYPTKIHFTQGMVDLWYEMFSELEEEGVKTSIDEYIKTNDFPPSVASIMKIYKAKETQRKEAQEYIENMYNWVARWYEEQPGEETYELFARHIRGRPLNEVKAATDALCEKVVRYYNDNTDNPDRKTLKEVLKM